MSKRIRTASGQGAGQNPIPSGQLLAISVVPHTDGSWFRLGEGEAIWIPGDVTLELTSEELGLGMIATDIGYDECGENRGGRTDRVRGYSRNDQFPGDEGCVLYFGENANPDSLIGGAPESWYAIYNG